MAARQTAPVIGALATCGDESAQSASRLHGFSVTIGYRYQSSFRHFIGTVEQKQRELLGTQIVNDYHLFDVAVEYQLSRRWSIMGSLPVLNATRYQLYNPKGTYHVAGIGDATIGARAWLFRGPAESGGNVALGFSLKMPTGKSDSRDNATLANGTPVLAVADQSIQAGDGGWGFALDVQAYRPLPVFQRTTMYFAGTYLFNPTDTNGVATFRSRPSESIMSVSDQYLFRGGLAHAVPKIRGLSASFGGRIEGVPVRDAFGASNGFRRPGYSISIDPGISYARGRYALSVNAPWAVERNRRRSVPDIADGRHGDAAFADYAIITSFTRHF